MDDKRFYRDLKKDIKKTGNRKRRRFLKDLSADPGEFDYGSAESSAFNGMGEMEKGKRKKHHVQEEKDPNEMDALANSDDSNKIDGSDGLQQS